MIVVELLVNVCDSMGANVVNTIAEQTSPFIMQILGQGRVAVRILSNLCTERLTMASFSVPIKHMGWKNFPGQEVVERIIEAQRFAELDPYRATTHNKGIMNGIDAVAVALGQDWRAVEAAAHSYASFGNGQYSPLTRYRISADG
jgi:degradative hydroxymethylglutaryl-CoA reductase